MKKWVFSQIDKEKSKQLVQETGLSGILTVLLTSRGVDTPQKAEKFLTYSSQLSDPFEIKDMDIACSRIRKAVTSYEKICVFGDYDCDGVTATAILYSYLESVGANVIYHIPSRSDEGYGMSKQAVKALADSGVKLIVTVDNGIACVEETDYAAQLGVDVIITDHHRPQDILPKAVAVVDPHRSDCGSEYKMYCGAGIALKLVTALEDGDAFSALENYADLAAIGTVADLVPVDGENRDIIKIGIENIKTTERVGLRVLIEKSGLDPQKISSGTIAYTIAPRINAAGRLKSAEDALRLLLTEDIDEAQQLADELCSLNTERKETETAISNAVNKIITEQPQISQDRIIVVSGEGWHQGVIGIATANIVDKYGKPAIIISDINGEARGSGRSIKGFSLCDAVFACSDLLEKYGGHPMAVGFSIKPENIDSFRRKINEYAKSLDEEILPTMELSCKLNPAALSVKTAKDISALEPFGFGNAKPVFALCSMRLDKITPLSGGKHLKLSLSRDNSRISALKFSTAPQDFFYREGDILDLAVTVDTNVYMGQESASIIIKDIKLTSNDNGRLLLQLRQYEAFIRGEQLDKDLLSENIPSREDFAVVYRYIRSCGDEADFLPEILLSRLKGDISMFKLLIILDIMKELYLISLKKDSEKIHIKIFNVNGKVDINASQLLRKLKESAGNA